MQRPPYGQPHAGHAGQSFDGPGARPILGEPGPSSSMLVVKSPPRSNSPPSSRVHALGNNHIHHPQPAHHQLAAPPGLATAHPYHQARGPPPHTHSTPVHSHGHARAPPVQPSSSATERPATTGTAATAAAAAAAPPLTPATTTPVPPVIKRVGGKANVSSACGPCKRAHLACDVARPCKRCVNMGKEDQCEDVPHKKRGRPKVNKTPTTDPYPRPTPRASSSQDETKWKPGPTYDSPYSGTAVTSPQSLPLGALASGRFPSPPRTSSLGSMVGLSPLLDSSSSSSSYSVPAPAPVAPPLPTPSASMPAPVAGDHDLFVLFCTTELKILRATHSCHHLTGYHPHEFVNLNLIDFLHPSDRHFIQEERSRLIALPYNAQLQSSRETHAAVMECAERDLLSPAGGMREPYPNQSVHVLRSDNSFSLFNLRLHLGGGLGGSIWEPGTLGKIYLVVSCLLLPDRDAPPDVAARRPQPLPPTPVTPLAPPPPHGLPGFSSIAAAADAPPRANDQSPQAYYRPPPPGSGYARPSSRSATYPPVQRPPSPTAYPPRSYSSYPPPYYTPAQGGHYDGGGARRDDDWRRGVAPSPGPGPAPLPGVDYRRWER